MRHFGDKIIRSKRLRVKHISNNIGRDVERDVNDWLEKNDVEVIDLDYFSRTTNTNTNLVYCIIKYLI